MFIMKFRYPVQYAGGRVRKRHLKLALRECRVLNCNSRGPFWQGGVLAGHRVVPGGCALIGGLSVVRVVNLLE